MDDRSCPNEVAKDEGVNKTIAATFKQQSVHKNISKLKDKMGVQSEWEDIAEVARRHFIRVIGTTAPSLKML